MLEFWKVLDISNVYYQFCKNLPIIGDFPLPSVTTQFWQLLNLRCTTRFSRTGIEPATGTCIYEFIEKIMYATKVVTKIQISLCHRNL